MGGQPKTTIVASKVYVLKCFQLNDLSNTSLLHDLHPYSPRFVDPTVFCVELTFIVVLYIEEDRCRYIVSPVGEL
jgi:hypothetical protein